MEQPESIEFLYEIFDPSLPRLGPGNKASTMKALQTLLRAGLPSEKQANAPDFKILDIGCGNGAQTIELARHFQGTVIALDNHRPFLIELMRRARAEGVVDKIRPYEKDMRHPELGSNSFHLIWSEGSLYVIGFTEGLSVCRDLLVPGGLMAVSELCWLKKAVPPECRRFLADEYPAITDVPTNLSHIRKRGYEIVGYFVLPEAAWWEDYYTPLEKRLTLLEDKHREDPQRLGFIDSVKREINIYRRFSDFYGYVFYLMQRE